VHERQQDVEGCGREREELIDIFTIRLHVLTISIEAILSMAIVGSAWICACDVTEKLPASSSEEWATVSHS
ncbi:MAG: hypothetical protein ABR543_06885, partial [Gemmatimonadaceae bacterium]